MLGTYGFDANGDTTLKSYGLYKVGPDGNPDVREDHHGRLRSQKWCGAVVNGPAPLLRLDRGTHGSQRSCQARIAPAVAAALDAVRQVSGRWGLVAALAALPIVVRASTT